MDSKAFTSAGVGKQETRWWEGSSHKGEMEAPPYVLSVPGREGNMPAHVSAMEHMLRQQHAVRQQNKPWLTINGPQDWAKIADRIFGARDFIIIDEVSDRDRGPITRTGGLLLCGLRTGLD